MMNKVLTVIVTYNAMQWIDRCIGSVLASSVGSDIFIIDNASADGTQEHIRAHYPQVIFRQSPDNLGFGKANNIGMRYAVEQGYDYVYLLNQDAWLEPGCMERLIEVQKNSPQFGILSPMQMQADMEHPDDNFRQNMAKNHAMVEDLIHDRLQTVYEVPYIMAAHWLISRECLLGTGCFSPTFPHYGEDNNYTSRAAYHGFRTGIVPAAKAVHDRAYRRDSKDKIFYLRYIRALIRMSDLGSPVRAERLLPGFVSESLRNASLKPLSYFFRLVGERIQIGRRRESSREKEAFLHPRVLFVTHSARMGGANHSMFRLIEELRERHGIKPFVVFPRGKDRKDISEKCREMGIPYLRTPFHWSKGRSVRHLLACLSNIIFYPLAAFRLRKYDFDLVHSNGSVTDLGAWLGRRRGLRHIWHLREFGDLDFGLRPLLGRRREKAVYSKGDNTFIAISEAVKEHYSSLIDPQKIITIYNGVALPEPAGAGKADSRTEICLVGMLQEAKNQLEALQAAAILRQRGRSDFHLHLIGRADGAYLSKLKKYISDESLEDYVSICGEREDISEILRGMDIGLTTSLCEAFGRVTVEYMLHGLAVIASDTGAGPEIITDGKNGLLYHSGDAEALAERLLSLLENREYRQQLAAEGEADARARFNSVSNSECIFKLY